MKISGALAAVVATGALSFGVVVPAAASAHKTSVHLSAHAQLRTVLIGTPIGISGSVDPAGVGPIVLERLVGQDWVVLAKARTTPVGAYSFSVGTAHRSGTWLLRVVRPATSRTREADSGTLRVALASAAYRVTLSPVAPVSIGVLSQVRGTVTPVPTGNVEVQQLIGTRWHTLASPPVGGNGGFAVGVSLAVGPTRLRVVERPSTTVAGGASAPVTAYVVAPPLS